MRVPYRLDESGQQCQEVCLWMLLQSLDIECDLAEILVITQLGVAVHKNRLIRPLVPILRLRHYIFGSRNLGTPVVRIVCAARSYGADGSRAKSFPWSHAGQMQAARFLEAHPTFIAIVSPSRLYGREPPRAEEWAHAVVVLAREEGNIIYHDPDGARGGRCLSMPVSHFWEAWKEHGFAAVLVKRR
jgi:hypothetical protein